MSKKISITSIIIVIAISFILSIYIPNRDKIENEDLSIYYETVEKDGKIGIVDQNKNTIIEPQYNDIIIVNPHRAVFFCDDNGTKKVINSNNVEIFKKYDSVEPIQITENQYDKEMLKYEKNGEYGLLGIGGNIVTDTKYEEISSFGYKEGEFLIKQDGKFGILDYKGQIKIKNQYDEIQLDGYYTVENEYRKAGYIVRITTEEGYRYGYYDTEGEQVLKEEYNYIARLTEIKNDSIYLIVAKNGQYGVFVNNSKIINTEYQEILYNSELEMFIAEKTGKFGAMNLYGAKVLDVQYSELTIKGIYLYGIKDEIKEVFNEKGEKVEIPFDTVITSTTSSKYFIRNDVGNYSIVNENLEKLTNQNYNFIEYAYDTYFISTNEENKMGVIDLEENIIIQFNYDVIQIIKGKNIIQAIDFSTNKTDIYDSKLDLTLEISNAKIEILDNGIKIYNNEQENFLDNNGKIITK